MKIMNGKSEIAKYMRNLSKNRNINKEERIKFDKTVTYIRLLKESGLSLGAPYIKYLRKGIWELRPLKERILFACWYDNKFIMLNHFTKETDKTPQKEILKAKKLFKNYKERNDKDE